MLTFLLIKLKQIKKRMKSIHLKVNFLNIKKSCFPSSICSDVQNKILLDISGHCPSREIELLNICYKLLNSIHKSMLYINSLVLRVDGLITSVNYTIKTVYLMIFLLLLRNCNTNMSSPLPCCLLYTSRCV